MLSNQSFGAGVGSGANNISGSFSKECTVVDVIEIPMAANLTNDGTSIAIVAATVESIAMQAFFDSSVASQATSDVTVKTNSSSMPDQTFTLKTNKPGVWNSDMSFDNPITTNITVIYVTNPR